MDVYVIEVVLNQRFVVAKVTDSFSQTHIRGFL